MTAVEYEGSGGALHACTANLCCAASRAYKLVASSVSQTPLRASTLLTHVQAEALQAAGSSAKNFVYSAPTRCKLTS